MPNFNPEDIYPTPNSGRFRATDDDSKTYHSREGIITKNDAVEERKTERKKFFQRLDDRLGKYIFGCIIVGALSAYFSVGFNVAGGAAGVYAEATKETIGDKLYQLVSSPGAILSTISKICIGLLALLIIYAVARGIYRTVKGAKKPLKTPPPQTPTASIGT